MQVPELLTASEVARRLNIGLRTVWRWNASGELPAPIRLGKAGRVVRWNAIDIETFLERALNMPSSRPSTNGCNGGVPAFGRRF